MMSTKAPGSQLVLLGLTRYFSGAVVRTLKATWFLVTLLRMIRHFFSVSLDPKQSSSAGLMFSKDPLKVVSGFRAALVLLAVSILSPSSGLKPSSVKFTFLGRRA
uniref:Uncharacterized protein n=1 Tax=Anguilla anguilla TaxID=7936 RepID=A0A0E9PK19_ANGAN